MKLSDNWGLIDKNIYANFLGGYLIFGLHYYFFGLKFFNNILLFLLVLNLTPILFS